MSGERHYRVFVVETRTVEVELWGPTSEREARDMAKRVAGGEDVEGGRIFKRHPVRRTPSTVCWFDRPNRLG